MKLNKFVAPFILSSMALNIQAKENFHDFDHHEYYIGASIGMSKLKGAEFNQDTDAEMTILSNQFQSILKKNIIPAEAYKQKRFSNEDIALTQAGTNETQAGTNELVNMDATFLLHVEINDIIEDAVTKNLLVKHGNNYILPAAEYKRQFDAKFAPKFLSENPSFKWNAENITQFSAIFGTKRLNSENMFFGLEAQATMFKEKYESLVRTNTVKESAYSSYPKEEKIYLTNIVDGTSSGNTITLSKDSEAIVYFDTTALPSTETFANNEQTQTTTFEFKRTFAFSSDIFLGKRFDLQKGMTLDAFAVLGYGYTSFEMKHDNTVISDEEDKEMQEIIRSMEKIKQDLEKGSTTGLRLGAGVTLNINQKYAVTFKLVRADLKGYSLFEDKLQSTDMMLSFQYLF